MILCFPSIERTLGTLCFIVICSIARAQEVHFISATPENTSLADCAPLPKKMEVIGWSWHPENGNGGVLESVQSGNQSSILLLKAAGLEAGAVYEVFGYFWANEAAAEGATSQEHHAIQLGLSIATLHPFDGERPDALVSREPWTITPGYKTGQTYGYQVAVEESDPLPGLAGMVTRQGNHRLIRARLGCSRAGTDGTLPVFFSANPASRELGSAMIKGIALRRAAPDASLEPGRKPGTQLHLAIRAGDPVTIRREIEAGADVNALDEDGITPLFYAAASGNVALVRDLLDHGARPNQMAQSVSPLTAAATISDPVIVRLLLEAGAEVPLSAPKDKGALAVEIDPCFLHPVVAAIRAGSVPVLQQILAANADLNLTKFGAELQTMKTGHKPEVHPIYFVGDSMLRMNWEMAAYLIDCGLPITNRDTAHYTDSTGLMLACAVHAGAGAMPVVEAMLRRGEPPVVPNSHDIYHSDALTTAAWRGDAGLVRRFLPLAAEVGPYYQNWLLEHALDSENPEIIDMIRSKFPGAKAPRWKPAPASESTAPLEEAAKRWFLARTSPPPQADQNQAKGKHVLAVLASPDAAGAGDVLAVQASQVDGWKVVDRELVESALEEAQFSKPWLDGEHRLAELGDRLMADCLVVVSASRVGKDTIYRFEVVEVATGLEIHREHFKDDSFLDKKEIAGFLERAVSALDAAGRNKRHQAITLLSFSTQGRIENPLAITALLRAAVQHEVDSTPGLISLSRAQSSRLMEEQALDGKNSVWGAAHMVEGVVSAIGDKGIKVTLRLETFKNGATSKTDVEAIGDSAAIAETAAAAWGKLMAASGNEVALADENPDEKGRSLNEGRRLMREAEWLHSLDADPASYLPLIESAIALGVPAKETILLHLDAHFRNFMFLYPKNSSARDGDHKTALQYLGEILPHQSPSLELSDRLAYHLPAARNFLHQTSWYLEHRGRDAMEGGTDLWQVYGAYKYNEIWYAIQALSAIRALINPGQLPDQLGPEFETFASELDALTRRYFSLLQSVPNPDFFRYCLQAADFRLYRRNPALADGLAAMAATGASLPLLLDVDPFENPDTGEGHGSKQFQWMQSRKDLAGKMIRKIGNDPALRMKPVKADLECFLADGSQRPRAIRQLLAACAEIRWHTAPAREDSGSYLLSQGILNSCTPTHLFDRSNRSISLEHNGSMVLSVLFSAGPAPDLLIRFNTYHKVFHVLNQLEAWKHGGNRSNIDPFRESILAYDHWELSRLRAEASSDRPVNGPPGETSSRHGPPGIGSTAESSALSSMILGAGKSAENPAKATAKKPLPAALKATLLADLRTGRSPGTIIWPLVDNVDSGRLWVFYFPSAGDSVRVNQAGGGGALNYGHQCTAPWLLGINCRDGSVIRKVNLHSAVGEAYGMDLSNRNCEVWAMALDQTKGRILTNVGWYDKGWSGNKMGSVIIDKETGRAHPIPGNPGIDQGKGDVSLDLWDRNNGVAAVGEHFFYFTRAGDWAGGAVFHVFPDLSVKPLTVTGRKPEATPFDAPNRAPISITPHGGRLMVIHPSTIAEYDPEKADWSITASLPSEKPSNKHTDTVADFQYWDFLRSIHELKVGGESTGWIAMGWWHAPGVLPFASRTKGRRSIHITAGIPDDFLNTTYAVEETSLGDSSGDGDRKTLIKNHPRFKQSNMVVLAQTEKDLILGMQTSDTYEWKHPSRNTHHLPFLWKVSKQEILKILQTD